MYTFIHALQYNECGQYLASNVRVRKLTEEHPEVESLLKQKSNPTSTAELQDDAQKRYTLCFTLEIILICTYKYIMNIHTAEPVNVHNPHTWLRSQGIPLLHKLT